MNLLKYKIILSSLLVAIVLFGTLFFSLQTNEGSYSSGKIQLHSAHTTLGSSTRAFAENFSMPTRSYDNPVVVQSSQPVYTKAKRKRVASQKSPLLTIQHPSHTLMLSGGSARTVLLEVQTASAVESERATEMVAFNSKGLDALPMDQGMVPSAVRMQVDGFNDNPPNPFEAPLGGVFSLLVGLIIYAWKQYKA